MARTENEIDYYHSIDRLYHQAFQECFQGLRFHQWGQIGPEFHADLNENNEFYKDSDYFYRDRMEFFHLTPIRSLFLILNNRNFRLYNLHNSEDEAEYGNAAELLGYSKGWIETAKRYLYTMSFCPVDELQNKHVWDVYGDKCSRAAIVFSVESDPAKWVNFHMAPIRYNADEAFRIYHKRLKEIERINPGITINCDLSRIIGFHKEAAWKEEKEVRIATYFPYRDLEEYWKYAKVDYRMKEGRNRETSYIELPIWVDNDSSLIRCVGKPELDRTQVLPADYFDTRPKIKLKQIVIGANSHLDIDEYSGLRSTIKNLVRNNFGYDVEVDLNPFRC